MKTHARQIQDLVNGYFKAYQYFRFHPQEAALKMQARLGKEPLQQFQGLYLPDLPENKKLLQGESAPILKSAQTLAELMLKRKLLIRPVTLKHFVEPAFLSAAKP